MTDEVQAPSAEDAAKMQQVAAAGTAAATEPGQTAAQATEKAKAAMKAERDRVQLKMSDEDIDQVAKRLSAVLTADLEARGAFDTPPDAVRPPTQPTVPEAPHNANPAEQPPQPPQKRTWAHKFMGYN
jgi:hypothetical protein